MDYLCTVGTLHQSEGRVSSFLLIWLLADLAHCREGKARLGGGGSQSRSYNQDMCNISALIKEQSRASYRETLP